jgi:hypothetical protein
MREANKALAKTALTREDIELSEAPEMKNLKKMLHTDIYEFKVRLALYKKKKLSPKGFLLNNDIYNLPIGKKDAKGVVFIDNDVMDLLSRFNLVNGLAQNGDALTAFLIEHDDKLYELFKEMNDLAPDDKIKDDEYAQLFSITYNRTSDKLIEHAMSVAFDEFPELKNEYFNILEKRVQDKQKEEKNDNKKTK